MQTDFAALRQYLEGAWLQARGEDEATCKIRDTLDLLIEAAAAAERYSPQPSAIVLFPKGAG